MGDFHQFMQNILQEDSELIEKEIPSINETIQEILNYCSKVSVEIDKYKKTGTLSPSLFEANIGGDKNLTKSKRSSSKENTAPESQKNPPARPKRNALKEASQQINKLSEYDQNQANIIVPNGVKIKTEKLSDVSKKSDNIPLDLAKVKQEQEMPAPTQIPPKKKRIKTEKTKESKSKKTESNASDIGEEKRSKRTRKKPARFANESQERKDSDVILQNGTFTTVELSDSEDNTTVTSEKGSTKENNSTVTRVTRTKTRNMKASTAGKRTRMYTSEDESSSNVPVEDQRKVKRTRSNSDIENAKLLGKKLQQADEVANKKPENSSNKNSFKETTTDDESDVEFKTPPMSKTSGSKDKEKKENSAGKSKQKNTPPNMDATMVIQNPMYTSNTLKSLDTEKQIQSATLNTTVVIDKKTTSEQPKQLTCINNDLMTDDESDEGEVIQSSPVRPNNKKLQTTNSKQIFSPFDPSPVKKKVEAFERLGAEASAIPTRITRTKTRAQGKEQKDENQPEVQEEARNNVKEKAKLFTPTISKFLPKTCSTTKISHKLPVPTPGNISTSNESLLSVKSASSLKASQAEFREREKRRREKEAEAIRKREALIQAQIEEKKRKREEKQLKAQQQREAMEKETQKKLEAQKIKEEKHKQLIAEREEKLQKQREELERKRMLAKKKALDEKKKEEARKAEEQKKVEEAKYNDKLAKEDPPQQPVYMVMKAPLLPTDDCYDSDDPEYNTVRARIPDWARDSELKTQQLCMILSGETLKNTFFCRQAQTPDLKEIFELIDPRKLKRTSSAIWRKPPRYTLMPTLDQHIEDSDEDDY